ncbi:hypothetical protein [uncultured Helicobacter sp.]|uniref:hypothetical protein n=1 Tax=uncultured Helicobacter sp. TaxID=175537 RepID=UPI00375345CA
MRTYSFIQPKPKSIFRRLTKIWIFYIVLMMICIALFGMLIDYQTHRKQNELQDLESRTQRLDINIIAAKDYLSRLHFEQARVSAIIGGADSQTKSSNERFADGFKRLLDIIPAQITLHWLKIDTHKLELGGITPSKEVYVFLLEAPLKASFDESRAEFFPLVNGWFNFVSVSQKHPRLQSLQNP